MRSLDLSPREYEPPSLCHTGLEALFALPALGAGAATAAEVGFASTLLAAPATAFGGAVTSLAPAAAIAAAPAVWTPAAAAAAGAGLTAGAASTGILGSGIGFGDVLSAGGTLLQAKSGLDQAKSQEEMAKAEAAALKQRANEEAAAGQRQAITRQRQAELVGSRARALAASSGTLATDPTQVDIEAGIAGQGQYNALTALYEGMAAAQSSTNQANIDLFKARRIRSAAPLAAAGTLFSGLSSLASKRGSSSRNYLLNSYGSI